MKSKRILFLSILASMAFASAVFSSCSCGGSSSNSGSTDIESSTDNSTELKVELNGFETEPSFIVEAGTAVYVKDPITIDEYGNVLAVTHQVKDQNGNEVVLDSNRFFAMQGVYTVTFSVTDSKGTVNTLTKKVYVFDTHEDTEAKLVESSFDLRAYLPEEIPDGYQVEYNVERWVGDKAVEVQTMALDNNLLTVKDVKDGCYKVRVTLKNETTSFLYSTAYVDLYQNGNCTWNDVIAPAYSYSYEDWNAYAYTMQLEKKDFTGETADWIKVDGSQTFANETSNRTMRYTLLPAHSKAYYEKFIGQDVVLKFDYYYQFANPEKTTETTPVSYSSDGTVAVAPNTLHTASISLERLVEIWTNIVNPPNTMDNSCSLIRFIHNYKTPVVSWFGNFRMENPNKATPTTVVHNTEVLVDTKSVSTFDLKELLTDEEESGIYQSEVKWSLSSLAGEVSVEDSIIQCQNVAQGLYDVYAHTDDEDEMLLFKGVIDIYDSAQNPVWLNDNKAEYVWAWRASSDLRAYNLASVVQLTETGHSGEYYKLTGDSASTGDYTKGCWHYNLTPAHSKTYYEQYADYVLTYEYYARAGQYYCVDWTETFRANETGWQQAKVSVQTLLDNWDYLIGNKSTTLEKNSFFYATGVFTDDNRFTYIGNVKMDIDVDTVERALSLEDVNGKLLTGTQKYPLKNLFTDEQWTKYQENAAKANVQWTIQAMTPTAYEEAGVWKSKAVVNGAVQTITDMVIDFAVQGYGIYQIQAKFTQNGKVYILYQGEIDFYNSTQAPVWTTIDNDALNRIWGWSGGNSVAGRVNNVASIVEEGGESCFKLTANSNHGVWMAWNIAALHTKEYYELYQGQGYQMTIRYKVPQANLYYSAGYTTTESTDNTSNEAKWLTATISLDTLIARYIATCGAWTNNSKDSFVSCTGATTEDINYVLISGLTLTQV